MPILRGLVMLLAALVWLGIVREWVAVYKGRTR